jgi:ribosomal protein L34/ribonuclease P protein component
MGKPTYRPRNKRRIRTHGFRERMSTRWGREVLSRRRKKGRKQLFGCQASTLAPRPNGYSRVHRLTREADLELVKRTGKRLRTEHLEVRARCSPFCPVRVAVVVSKRGHTIVQRNRLKRRLRELARTRIIPGRAKLDLVIRSLSTAYDATFQQLKEEIDSIATQLSLRSTD